MFCRSCPDPVSLVKDKLMTTVKILETVIAIKAYTCKLRADFPKMCLSKLVFFTKVIVRSCDVYEKEAMLNAVRKLGRYMLDTIAFIWRNTSVIKYFL